MKAKLSVLVYCAECNEIMEPSDGTVDNLVGDTISCRTQGCRQCGVEYKAPTIELEKA
jgi:DNA-directed RNA polymerase subunit M/transcription elongation factor TFIIS